MTQTDRTRIMSVPDIGASSGDLFTSSRDQINRSASWPKHTDSLPEFTTSPKVDIMNSGANCWPHRPPIVRNSQQKYKECYMQYSITVGTRYFPNKLDAHLFYCHCQKKIICDLQIFTATEQHY